MGIPRDMDDPAYDPMLARILPLSRLSTSDQLCWISEARRELTTLESVPNVAHRSDSCAFADLARELTLNLTKARLSCLARMELSLKRGQSGADARAP